MGFWDTIPLRSRRFQNHIKEMSKDVEGVKYKDDKKKSLVIKNKGTRIAKWTKGSKHTETAGTSTASWERSPSSSATTFSHQLAFQNQLSSLANAWSIPMKMHVSWTSTKVTRTLRIMKKKRVWLLRLLA